MVSVLSQNQFADVLLQVLFGSSSFTGGLVAKCSVTEIVVNISFKGTVGLVSYRSSTGYLSSDFY